MASIASTVEPDGQPPRVTLRVDATPGCLLRSCLVRRVQNGVLSSVRRQPPVGVDSGLCYDYESWYGVPCSYEASGLEQVQPLTAMWQGAVNSSESRLLDGSGNVIATNLLPTPRPASGDTWNTSVTQTVDGFAITTNTTYTGQGDDHNIYPSSYDSGAAHHFHAETDDVLTTTYPDFSIYIEGGTSVDSSKLASPSVIDVDIPAGININRFSFKCGLTAGDHVTWRHLGLYTAADWQAMQEAGVTWFDGDYARDASTQSYDVSSSPLTLSPDSGWLIHPGNPAKSMRLPMGYVTGIGGTTRRISATRHDRLGARYPVYTIPGPRYSREYTLNLRTRGPDDEQMLLALTDDQTPLLIDWLHDDAQRLNMDPMYIQVGDISSDRYAQMLYPADASTPLWWRDWQLPCIEVDSPAVSQQAVGWTYAQLLSEQPTYQSVMDEYATYADLTARQGKDH